jgi:hypothetical protein
MWILFLSIWWCMLFFFVAFGVEMTHVCPFCAVPLRAPKWYKRPAGVSFGFGGKLVSFRPSASGSPAGASEARFQYF